MFFHLGDGPYELPRDSMIVWHGFEMAADGAFVPIDSFRLPPVPITGRGALNVLIRNEAPTSQSFVIEAEFALSPDNGDESQGLEAWEIALVVIGVLLAIGIAFFAYFFCTRKRIRWGGDIPSDARL
jgi:hypothetical protein